MKKIIMLLGCAALVMSIFSCHKSSKSENDDLLVGAWPEMVVNEKSVAIPKAGGSFTFKVENYPGWWMSRVQATSGDVKTIYSNPKDVVQSDWFTVECPKDSSELIVTVAKNETVDARKIVIEMTAGDIFESVQVLQNRY